MTKHKSAIKKHRQDEVRRLRNKAYTTRVKTVVKKVEAAIADKDKETADKALYEAVSVMDRVASKGIIHKNTAARKKSRLSKKVNALAVSA
jgi:small subunit ribosomal protein S20